MKRIRGRLLCFAGLHRWEHTIQLTRTLTLTSRRCTRELCALNDVAHIVDLEPRRQVCGCRRHAAPSPICPLHGKYPAAA